MKFLVVAATLLVCCQVSAHEDRSLDVSPSGQIIGLPAQYGPLHVDVRYSNNRDVKSVRLSGRQFSIKLNRCALEHLTHVVKIRASGSWYHDLSRIPPYVSLQFLQELPTSEDPSGQGISITFSLTDGQILMADRRYDPWWGGPRGKFTQRAASCSGWRDLALWPNNSFKPTPLRGAA
jgi:hypothetical protein